MTIEQASQRLADAKSLADELVESLFDAAREGAGGDQAVYLAALQTAGHEILARSMRLYVILDETLVPVGDAPATLADEDGD